MLKSMKMFLCSIVLLASLPNAGVANAAEPQREPFAAYVREQFAEAGFPGGAFAVFEQGEIVLAEGIGYSNLVTKREATPDTVYSTASITKVLTAAAILKLAEEQQLELDAPVTAYLPWFQYKDAERSAKVTVRHLLTHSAGVNRLSADGAIYQDIRNNRNSLENAAKALRTVEMNNEPGAAGQYCNTCYNLLGLIIEAVTGQNYETYMQEQWFETLGMNHTTFAPYGLSDADVAKEYGYLFGFQTEVRPYWKEFGSSQAPEGGVYSSAIDLARWATVVLEAASPQVFESGVVASDLSDVIYTESGFERTELDGVTLLHKSGDGMGSSSYMAYIPSLRTGFVLLVGESHGEATKLIGEGMIQLLIGKTPDPVGGTLNVFKLLGSISLGIVFISLLLAVMLVGSMVRLRRNHYAVKRRWAVAVRLLLYSILSVPIWLLLILFRPTEAGFYGYPYDLASAMIALAVTASLWALYSALILIKGRENN